MKVVTELTQENLCSILQLTRWLRSWRHAESFPHCNKCWYSTTWPPK